MKKYTYSRQIGNETFTAVEFDSFEEAIKAVDKGVYHRELETKPVQNPVATPENFPDTIKINEPYPYNGTGTSSGTTSNPQVHIANNGDQNINK